MARTLFLTFRSPYARKIQIILAEKELEAQLVTVDLGNKPPEFLALGPIAKVPVLVDGEQVVFDSTVIAEYLEDRYPQPSMYGSGWEARLISRRWEELGDSIGDAAITVFFGREPVGVAKAQSQLDRVLVYAEEHLGELEGGFGVAHASLLSGLGYLSFRLGDGWKESHPLLASWVEAQQERPSVATTVPRLG